MAKKKKEKEIPEVHKDLEGFDIRINEFGQIIANYDIKKINDFLNQNTDDKKIQDKKDSDK